MSQAQREKIIREEQDKQEEAFCQELSRLKLEKERDEKMRQQILETRCDKHFRLNMLVQLCKKR
jgi:hypothetical protein